MLKKLFNTNWFILLVHLIIIICILFNGFYLLENFKVGKANLKITEQKLQLEQDKKNLTEQNSYEFLDNYKDKTIKKAGFKKAGEQIYDITKADKKNPEELQQIDIPNYEKWYKCLFNKNSTQSLAKNPKLQLDESTLTSNFCK